MWNLFLSWMQVFSLISSRPVLWSTPFDLRLLRVHPFAFDETFVFLCLWSPEPHDVRRHEIVVKGLQFIDKIRVTHRSFSELIYWIATSLLIISRWTKCQCRFSQLLQKKKSCMWDLKNIDQTNTSYFSDRQMLRSSRVVDPYQKELDWGHFCWCNDVTGWISAVFLYDS